MASIPSAEQLWQFSLALYPKVKHIVLQWQDELNANVNLLLLLCYVEQQHGSFTVAQLSLLAAQLNTFSKKFTQPLRAIRRNSHCALLNVSQQTQLKQHLLQTELKLEQLEQELLLQHSPALSAQAVPMLELYLVYLATNPTTQQQHLSDLRQAVAQLS